MKLNHLEIDYFRCFNNYKIEFAPGITVLIGKNGAGKSTLINAIHKSLSFVFKKNTSKKNDQTLTSGIPSLKVETFNRKKDLIRNPETGFAYTEISIKAKGSFFNELLEWEMYAPTSTFKIQSSRYSEAFTNFLAIANREKQLPVLAFYSDSFPHIKANQTKSNNKLTSLRNFGYYQWNEETACSSIWIDKLKKTLKGWERCDRKLNKQESLYHTSQDTISSEFQGNDMKILKLQREQLIADKNEYEKEINSIKKCLIDFTEKDSIIEVKDLFLDVYEEELCIETTQGNNPCFDKLPAGYKRLLYIVLEIAYRSFILNESSSSSGIVIIDEIDLHLHPSLEQSVLQRLSKTFPNIQFIVSTHSALVIANLDTSKDDSGSQTNKVYLMQPNTDIPILLPNAYGVDYNATLRDFMETPSREKEIKYLIDDFLSFKSLDMEEEANSIYHTIIDIVGEDSSILKEIDQRLKEL